MKKISINKVNDFFLLLLLVGTTGFSFFYKFNQFIVILFLYSALIFFSRKITFDKGFFYIIIFMILIQIGQGIKFHYWPINTYIGLHLRLFSAYFVIKILGKSFVEKYIKFIYYFSIISLFIFIPLAFSKSLVSFFINNIAPFFKVPFTFKSDLYSLSPQILVYNLGGFSSYLYPRNSGPFWEPGAFAGFLIIAIMFELFRTKQLFSKMNIVNIIALITTTSTTGFIAFGLIFLYYNTLLKKRGLLTIPTFVIIAFILIVSYLKINFLKTKIDHAIFVTEHSEDRITRFQSAILDFNDFKANPIVGVGRNAETSLKKYMYLSKEIYIHRNNGDSRLLKTYGIFFFLMYLYLYYKGFLSVMEYNNTLSDIKIHAIFFVFIILLIGFSEQYFFRPLFYSFLFLNLVYEKNRNRISNI